MTTFTYDAAGNQTQVTDASHHVTTFVYNDGNRRTQVVYPDSTKELIAYDALGRTIKKTDQAGKETRFTYDALGRLIKVTDALNQETTYGYDERGNQISQTDANGHVTTFAYDRQGRRIARQLPLGQTESMSYDAAGNLVSKTDFNGKVTIYTYDSLNRLVSKTPDPDLSEPTVSYSYTASGQRAAMTDATGTTNYTYNNRDRLTEKATPQGTLKYAYTANGSLAGIQSNHVNGVDLAYDYDSLNRLAKVTDRQINGETTYSYDTVGNLAGYVYPNGVETAYTYNALNRLADMQVKKGATALARYSYTLGATCNRTQVQELGGRTVQYAYDDLYRLVKETISGVVQPNQSGEIGYGYDPVGNRLSRTSTLPAITNQSFTYDANDRLNTESYDANGSTIGSDGKTFAYDFENHLTEMNSGEVGIVYDGDGNRVAKTVGGVTTRYLVDDRNPTGYAQVLEEIENGAVVRSYTYGLDLISQNQAGGVSFYGYDGHGSVRLLTDASGTVTDRYGYDAFGNLVNQEGSTLNNYLYSGEQLDGNVGFLYLRARYADAINGRFLTRDPFDGLVDDPSSLHGYLYTNANPVNSSDPTGRFTLTELSVTNAIASVLHVYEIGHIAIEAWKISRKLLSRSHFPFFLSKELHYHRNELFSRVVPPNEENMLDLQVWKLTEEFNGETPTHNIGTTGNRDYRGRGPLSGEQAIYHNGKLVTTSENGGSFDFYPPPDYEKHFFWDVLPWLYWGNTSEDTTTPEQRFDAAMKIPPLKWTIILFIKP